MITIIRKIMAPTTIFPLVTNVPKTLTTSPASARLRLSLVVATLSDKRNKVIVRSSEGKTENSSASLVYMDTRSITIARHRLNESMISIKKVGIGITSPQYPYHSQNYDQIALIGQILKMGCLSNHLLPGHIP
jgi:hypothetical protein